MLLCSVTSVYDLKTYCFLKNIILKIKWLKLLLYFTNFGIFEIFFYFFIWRPA